MASKGRKGNSVNRFIDTVKPQSAEQAILIKQDEIIDKLNAILAAIEAGTDGDSLFTALDTAPIKANLSKVVLK